MRAGPARRSWPELVALRAILLNVLFKQANAQILTAEEMQRLIDRAPTDTTDTVLRGSPANKGNYRNCSLKIGFACNPYKRRVLSRKCRHHNQIAATAVIESLPLRQSFRTNPLETLTENR